MRKTVLFQATIVVWLTPSVLSDARGEPLMVLYPDLIVSDLSVTTSRFYIQTVKVTVKEICKVDVTSNYYVWIHFVDSKNIGNSGPPVKAGKSHTQTFDVSNQKIIAQSFVRAQVNPYNSVAEDTTDNNWLQIQPKAAPFPVSGTTHCKPKPWYFWFPLPGQ
jgi:hypothetical protein